MSFNERLIGMLEHVGYDLAERPTVDLVFSCSLTVAEMDFFDPILEQIFARDFTFSESREAEIDRTIRELLVNSRSACLERRDKFVKFKGYLGSNGLVTHVRDDGPGFNALSVIEERRKQLHLYDRDLVVRKARGCGEGYGEGGVGMYSLLAFAQDFEYSPKGNEVAVRFDLER